MQKKFNIILLVFSMVLASAAVSVAAENVCFSWTKNANLEGKDTNGVVGYRLYRNPTTETEFIFPDIVQDNACNDPEQPTKCSTCVAKIDDNKNHRYTLTAYNDAGQSDFSQPADDIIETEMSTVTPIGQAPNTPAGLLKYLITVETIQ